MKKIIILFTLIVCCSGSLFAQPCKASFLGSKTLYKDPQQKYTPAPKGYEPVFINHVGRHGARHLTKDVNTSYVYRLLMKADSLGALTTAGKQLNQKVLLLEKIEKKSFKSISEEGKSEQVALADRMYRYNSNVFRQPVPAFNIAYTKEIRTSQTSDAFLNELKTKINAPAVTKQINDTTLRFYDLSPAYVEFEKDGNWSTGLASLKKTLSYQQVVKQFSQQFFTPAFFSGLTDDDQDQFTSDIYGFVTIAYSLQKEIQDAGHQFADLDMQPYFTCDQLSVLGNIDNAEDYLKKGPADDINGIQVKIALPLLADFIRTTDDFITTKAITAQFRFCHAETISPYAALLGFAPAETIAKKVTDINKVWNAAAIIPLSANIQWIVYKKTGSENYLVKFLLNEKETPVKGLTTKTYPYYNWSDVRAFYIKKMESFNSGLATDYIKYLKEVK